MRILAGAVWRGIRSRGLLSAGSILLVALALASAVLGPVFQVAVTRSYVVTRVNEAPPDTTGLARSFAPTAEFAGTVAQGEEIARTFAEERDRGPFGPVTTTRMTRPVTAGLAAADTGVPGDSVLLAKEGACEHLVVDGRCPTSPGEAIVLGGDLEFAGAKVGDRLDMGPDIPAVTIVGTYRVEGDQQDFWFDLDRLASSPRRIQDPGVDQPWRPAPYIVAPDAFDAIPPTSWRVLFDRRMEVPPDWTPQQLTDAQASGRAVAAVDELIEGGRVTGDPVGALSDYLAEARAQEATAKASIAPAVLSLVLVALALLMRLLSAGAELRTPELALASLRGVAERRLWALGLVEPLLLIAAALPLGIGLGIGMSLAVMRLWLVPGLPLPWPALTWATTGLVLACAVAVSVAAVAGVITGSLSAQLTGVRRPTASRRAVVLAELALVALALATLASKLTVTRPGDPDLTDMVLPLVLAVVVGLLGTRLIAALARWRSRRPGRTLPGFVAARALGRRAEGTLVILPLTAAIAVGVFAVGVYDAAAQWRSSVASTASPAATIWKAPGSMSQAVAATHRLDPEGEHLMAIADLTLPDARFSVVDGPRMSSVLTWPDQWSPGVSVEEVQELISSRGTPVEFTGTTIALRARNDVRSDRDLTVQMHVVAVSGEERELYLGPFGPGESTVATSAGLCRVGCTVSSLTIGGPAALQAGMHGTLTLEGLLADGEEVPGALGAGAYWGESAGVGGVRDVADVDASGDVLVVDIDTGGGQGVVRLVPGGIGDERPVAVGVDSLDRLDVGADGTASLPVTGVPLPVRNVQTVQSMPFLGPDGVLIDFRQLTTDRVIFDQTFVAYVAADAATPAALSNALAEAGYTPYTSHAEQQHTLSQGAYALALRLYSVVAVLVLLMALAGLIVSTAVQLPARRRDAAALRVVGVPRRAVMSAVAREFAVVLAGASVAGIAAGALAQYVVVRTVRLGYVESIATPALVARVDWGWIALLAGLAAVVFGAFALTSALLTVRGARGATLRESAR